MCSVLDVTFSSEDLLMNLYGNPQNYIKKNSVCLYYKKQEMISSLIDYTSSGVFICVRIAIIIVKI